MAGAAQRALENQLRNKLMQILHYRHLQLKSLEMKLPKPPVLKPKDKDYKAAFAQQDRANELFRGTNQYSDAWKSVSNSMPRSDIGEYTAALKKFLDGQKERDKVGGFVLPTTEPSIAMAVVQFVIIPRPTCPPTPQLSRAVSVLQSQVTRSPTPTTHPSRAASIRPPSVTFQPTPPSSATTVGQRDIRPPLQTLQRKPAPNRATTVPLPFGLIRKRKAEDVAFEDAVARRDEHQKARLNDQTGKHSLLQILKVPNRVKAKEETPEEASAYGFGFLAAEPARPKKAKDERREGTASFELEFMSPSPLQSKNNAEDAMPEMTASYNFAHLDFSSAPKRKIKEEVVEESESYDSDIEFI